MPLILKGLARLNRLRFDAGLSITTKKRWLKKLGSVKHLLYSNDWDEIHAGWRAFYFLRNTLPPKLTIQAYQEVPITKGIYRHLCWTSPWEFQGAIVLPYRGRKGKRSPTELFAWAAVSNYYPVFSEPAWVYLKSFLLKLNELAPNYFPEGVSV